MTKNMKGLARDNIVILLPAYNEASSLRSLLARLVAFAQVIVIDDASRDETAKVSQEAGARVLKLKTHQGKGAALKEGIRYALDRLSFEALICMDADGQHDAGDLTKFLRVWEQEKPDLVLGERDFSSTKVPFLRKIGNKMISAWLSFLLKQRFPDSQCGFRLLSRKACEVLRLTKNDYGIETEIIIEAVKNKLTIAHVPVKTIYTQEKRVTVRGECKRAFRHFSQMVGYSLTSIAPRLREQWRFFSLIVFFSLLTVLFYQALDGIDLGSLARKNSFGHEMKTALMWLKEHSPEDAIVMTHWFWGHQVVAFADRRVVATTKVYPSESKEVAARYRDIGTFFLTSDEKEAGEIAAKYGASYIFLAKDVPAYLCKATNQCELAPNKRTLAPWARNTTIAGLMAQGTELSHFKKVWDSSRFVIYRVTDEEQGLSDEAKRIALFIARSTLEALLSEGKKLTAQDFNTMLKEKGFTELFSQPKGVDVSIWNNQHIRASRLRTDGSFLENLLAAAYNAANDERFAPFTREELVGARIEVIVFGDDVGPLDLYSMYQERVNPSKGYVLEYLGKKTYFLPEIFNATRVADLFSFLDRLCVKATLLSRCYENPDVHIATFSLEDFIEKSDKTGALSFSGPIIEGQEGFSRDLLREGLRLGAEWFLKNQDTSGLYTFTLDALSGKESKELEWARNVLASQALVRFYALTKDERYLRSALRNRAYLEERRAFVKEHYPDDNSIGQGLTLFGIFRDVELFSITSNPMYLSSAKEYAISLGSLLKDAQLGAGDISDYQRFAAIAMLARVSGDTSYLKELKEAAAFWRDEFRTKRILNSGELSLASNAWLVNAFRELYTLTGKEEYAAFALEVASWLTDYQNAGEAYTQGSFFNTPSDSFFYTRGSGKVAEALADAVVVAQELGDEYHKSVYEESLRNDFTWLMRMQLTEENSFWVNPLVAEKAIGALRHDLLKPELWNDSVSHFLLAGSSYLLVQ